MTTCKVVLLLCNSSGGLRLTSGLGMDVIDIGDWGQAVKGVVESVAVVFGPAGRRNDERDAQIVTDNLKLGHKF